MEQIQYFIEDRQSHLWWYPKAWGSMFEANIITDATKEEKIKDEQKLDEIKRLAMSKQSPSPGGWEPTCYRYNFNDGWTSDPNHPDIGYSNIEIAKRVMKMFELSEDEFEVTEHIFT